MTNDVPLLELRGTGNWFLEHPRFGDLPASISLSRNEDVQMKTEAGQDY